MQSDTWGTAPQQFNNNQKFGRVLHNRDTSLSSIASTAGPTSPFSIRSNTNPQVAINDFRVDGLPDMTTGTDANDVNGTYYQLAKSMTPYAGYQSLDQPMPELAYPVTLSGPTGKLRADRTSLLPAPEFGNASTKSQPASVASSIASDSPATPTNGETENERRTKGYNGTAPRLDRTMTDVYGDELYSPNFAITSTSPPQPQLSASPLNNELFAQRLSAANSQHLSASHSPVSSNSRDRSPFRTDSPMGSSLSDQNQVFNTAQRMREQSKARHEAQLQQALGRSGEPETPKTISPKDAVLEFNDSEGDANFPLFPQDSTPNFDIDLSKAMVPQQPQVDLTQPMMPSHPVASAQNPHFLSSQVAQSLQVPQQYPFIARTQASHTPPRLSSAGSSSSGSGMEMTLNRQQPMSRHADSGTYTCTYHGCTLRFETPALLQKHKREGHRQTQGLGLGSHGMTSTLLNTQAGPHRCDRINPATGKPCGTIFSRPYDLTRHEDTIHNARKRKVRCDLCTEEKTFSRADALTRHYRVCHPEAEVPGKHRRRG